MDRRYILVAVAVCLMACGTMGLPNAYGVFYTPMSEGLGAGRGAVTLHMSLSNLAIGLFTPVVSKFALGAIADKIGAFKAIVCSLVTTVAGLVLILLNLGGQGTLLASGFLYGTCFSIGSLGISLLVRHLFGDAQYSDAYATISLVTSCASALGVTAAGLAYDVTGSYAAPIVAGIALVVVAAGCLAYLHWRVTTRPWEKKMA